MARMVFSAGGAGWHNEIAAQALSSADGSAAKGSNWSIDEVPMGTGWHDSSWLLRAGLDVVEDAPAIEIPPDWVLRWWFTANAPLAARPA